jgi:hypothetical protein
VTNLMRRNWRSLVSLMVAAGAAALLGTVVPGTGAARGQAVSTAAADAGGATKATVDAPAGRRVFYCSHSLMWDIPDALAELAAAYGIKNHALVGHERMGFSTTLQHWQQADAGNQSKKALDTREVEAFIMSPMEFPDAGIDNFVTYGLQKNPATRFFVQNNWAMFNQDMQKAHGAMGQIGQVNWDATTLDQVRTLNAENEKECEKQVSRINKEIGRRVIFIIPTSQANATLRARVIAKEFPGLEKQSEIFADAIGHPKPPTVALSAYVHFAVIYGRSPVGLPMPAVLKKANNPKWDEAFNKRLQEIAWDTVQRYPYSGVGVALAMKP